MTDLKKICVGQLTVNVFYDARTRSSFCWKYFGHLVNTDGNKRRLLNTDQVYCLPCLADVKRVSEDITFGTVKIKSYNKTVSTGNLTRHLRENHLIQDDQINPRLKRNIKEVFSTSSRPAKSSSTRTKKDTSRDKWLLARDLALWFCKSLLPFDSVCDEGMVDFFKKYNIIMNNDEMPSRNVVSGSALSDVYKTMLGKVKEHINNDGSQHFALALDIWADQYRPFSYITFTLHYLTSDFVLKSLTLSTEMLTGKRTVAEINDAIKDIGKKFALNGKSIVAVTNGGENVKRAVSMANMSHHLCLGHGLHNLVMIDGIKSEPDIAALVLKCKKIVKTLKYHAPELQAEIEKSEFLGSLDGLVDLLEFDEGDPITELDSTQETPEHIASVSESKPTLMPTRWHIVVEMLNTVISIRDSESINNMLMEIGEEELIINQIEWFLIEEMEKFLKGFQEAVQILSSQKTSTLNVALVFRSEIIDVLNSYKDCESLIMLRLKSNMLTNINKRFPVTKAVAAAALLDNRFMSLKEVDVFLENQNMTRSYFLASYIRELISIDEIPQDNVELSSDRTIDSDNNTSLLHKLSKKHSIDANQGIRDDPIEQECWRYIATADPSEPKDGNLLFYWQNKAKSLPYLSALAKALLCVPATSISSERMFTEAGLSISARKSRLNAISINKIVFIHDNYKNCTTDEIDSTEHTNEMSISNF